MIRNAHFTIALTSDTDTENRIHERTPYSHATSDESSLLLPKLENFSRIRIASAGALFRGGTEYLSFE